MSLLEYIDALLEQQGGFTGFPFNAGQSVDLDARPDDHPEPEFSYRKHRIKKGKDVKPKEVGPSSASSVRKG